MPDRLLINVFNVDAALAAGRAKGIFAAHGLEVDVKVTPNSTEQMRGLGKGSWQIVSTAFDNVLGWAGREGAEIVAVAQVSAGNARALLYRARMSLRLCLGKSWYEAGDAAAARTRGRTR